MKAKVNILVVTYKQQEELPRALDSVLSQADFGLNKIVVQEDCSPDNTWGVLKQYSEAYPHIIEAHRNEKNLGIYGNFYQLVCNRGEADFFFFLAGDDIIKPGVFEAFQKFIEDKNISFDESAGVFLDWECVKPDGSSTVYTQELVSKGYSPYSLFIRHRLYQRGMFISRKMMDNYEPAILDKGLNLAEYMFDSQVIRKAERYYYLPFVGSVYYNGIGVSTQLGHSRYYKEDELIKLEYFLNYYTKSFKDKMWLKACIYRTKYYIRPSIKSFILMIHYYLFGVARYDMNISSVKSFFYPVIASLRKTK